MTLTDLVTEYAPYNTMEAFGEGFVAYQWSSYNNPHDPNSAAAQAWDRGLEAGMRASRLGLTN